jgi:hypothetical protein
MKNCPSLTYQFAKQGYLEYSSKSKMSKVTLVITKTTAQGQIKPYFIMKIVLP